MASWRVVSFSPLKKAPGPRTQKGFSLVEVVLALACLAIELLAIWSLLFSVIQENTITALGITATNAMRKQLSEVEAIGRHASKEFKGVANGTLNFFNINPASGTPQSHRDRIAIAGDAVTYTFILPKPGAFSQELQNTGTPVDYELSKGTMKIFLNEANVPSIFTSWGNMMAGVDEPQPRASAGSGFDMNNDGTTTENFISYANASPSVLKESGIANLPIQYTIEFFKDPESQARNAPYYSVTRYMILNNDKPDFMALPPGP